MKLFSCQLEGDYASGLAVVGADSQDEALELVKAYVPSCLDSYELMLLPGEAYVKGVLDFNYYAE